MVNCVLFQEEILPALEMHGSSPDIFSNTEIQSLYTNMRCRHDVKWSVVILTSPVSWSARVGVTLRLTWYLLSVDFN